MENQSFNKQLRMKVSQMSEEDQIFHEQAQFFMQKQRIERIDNFNGEYFGFLNNDFPSLVGFDGMVYPSVNAAFQAARTNNQHIRHKLSLIDTPYKLWQIAVNIDDPVNWQQDRLRYMELLLRDKFRRNRELRERLKLTGERQLINTYEQSTPSNIFWGIVGGQGQNQLGRLLEAIRQDIMEGSEIDKWIMFSFRPETEEFMMPMIHIDVIKEEKVHEQVTFMKKPYYIIGNLKTNDIFAQHISISRLHCALFCDQEQNFKIVDLQSKAGTFLNGELIEPLRPYQLNDGDIFNLAQSTRKYKVKLDYSEVIHMLKEKEREISKELTLIEKINDPNITNDQLRQALGFAIEDTLFVSQLPFHNNPKDIKDIFNQFGKVKQVRVPIDRQTGQQKPMALITFYNEKDAKSALLKADRYEYKGKKIKVQFADKMLTTELIEEARDFDKIGEYREKEIFQFSKIISGFTCLTKLKDKKKDKKKKDKKRSKKNRKNSKERVKRESSKSPRRDKHKKHRQKNQKNDKQLEQKQQQDEKSLKEKEKKQQELLEKFQIEIVMPDPNKPPQAEEIIEIEKPVEIVENGGNKKKSKPEDDKKQKKSKPEEEKKSSSSSSDSSSDDSD